jgi:hypothetical protein
MDADSDKRQLLNLLFVGLILAEIFLFAKLILEYVWRQMKLNIPASQLVVIKGAFMIIAIGGLAFILIRLVYSVYNHVSTGDYTKLWALVFILAIMLIQYFSDRNERRKSNTKPKE